MRFGVLGTGFWARVVHATALASHPDAELVGVWGRDLAKAKALGAEFDVAGYDDLDQLLAQCDAVSISLPVKCWHRVRFPRTGSRDSVCREAAPVDPSLQP